MNHPITIGGLLCALGIVAGIIACGVGVLMFFGGLMSDATDEAGNLAREGMIVGFGGLALAIFCIVKLI